MFDLNSEALVAAGTAVLGTLFAAAKWFVTRSVRQFDERLDDHETRLSTIEAEYVTKDELRGAITEIKDAIDLLGTDLRRGVETAHARLDNIYNELLRRAGS